MRSEVNARFHALVEEDLNHERAAALGRAGRRLGAAVAACREALADLDRHVGRGDGNTRTRAQTRATDRAADRYRAVFAHYQRVRTDFCVQREANRLYDHRLVDRFYPPPPRPAVIGISRR